MSRICASKDSVAIAVKGGLYKICTRHLNKKARVKRAADERQKPLGCFNQRGHAAVAKEADAFERASA
jgi:hypothetical protein